MSIASQNNKVAYLGNGSATLFPINFAFMTFINKEEHLKVAVTDPNGTLAVLSKSEYRLEQSGGEYSLRYPLDGAGGALANGWRITIVREVPLTQPLDLANGSAFNADVIESAFDYQEMQIQQLAEQLSRTPQVPIDSTKQGAEIYEEFMQGIDATLAAQNFAEASAQRAETAANKTEFLSNGFALASSTALANIKAAETHALEDINADGKEQVDLIKAVGDECLAKIIEVCPEAGQGGGGGLNLLLQSASFVAKAGMGYFLKPTDTLEMTLPEYPLIGDTVYFKGDFGAHVVNFMHGAHPINIPTIGSESLKDIMFAVTYDGTSWTVSRLSGELGLLVMKPSITAPIQGALNVSPNYTFKATHFDELDSADTAWKTRWLVKRGKVVVIDTGEIAYSDTFKPALPLEQGVTLTVQKYDIGKLLGATSWSSAVTFTTAIQSIVTPKIVNLADGSVDVAIPLHLEVSDFEAVGLPDEFGIKSELQVSKDEFFTQLAYDSGEVDYTINFTVPANLTKPLTTYFIRTRQKGDTFGWSPWSDSIKFTTKDVALLPPSILVPTEGLEKVTSKPLIVLEAFAVVGGTDTPSKTRIQASISPTFATILQDSGEIDYATAHTFADALPRNTVIHLRAQHKGVLLGDTGWGAVRSFKTADFVPSYHKFEANGLFVAILAACVRSDGTLTLLGLLQGGVSFVIIHYNQVSGEIIKKHFLSILSPSGLDLQTMTLTKNDDILLTGASYISAWEGQIVFVSEDFKTTVGVRTPSMPISGNFQLLAKNIDKNSFYLTGTDSMGNGYHATVLENGSIDGSVTKTTGSGSYQYSMVRADDALVIAYPTKLVVFSQTHSLIKGVSHPLAAGVIAALSNSDQNGAFYYARSNSASPAQLDIYPISSNLTSSSGLNLAGAALTIPRLRLGTDNALLLSGNVSPAIGKMLVLQFKAGFSGIDKTPFAYSPMYSGETCFSKNGDVLLLSRSIVMERDFNFRGTMPCNPLASCVDSTSIVTTSIPALTFSDYSPTMTKVAPVTSPLAFSYSETPLTHVHCQLA